MLTRWGPRPPRPAVVSNTGDDLDAGAGVALDASMACVHVLFIRQGKVLGSRSRRKCRAAPSWEVVETFCRPVLPAGQ